MFRKISLDDIEVMRKYRVQTRNFYVSSLVEEFTCGASTSIMNFKDINKEVTFGISKGELKISNRQLVCGLLGNINGG